MGIADSYVGIYAGNIARRLIKEFPDGHLAFNIPIETPDGIVVVDVGWTSAARMKGLRTRPSWNGAPDIAVCVVSKHRSEVEANRNISVLMRAGAIESWIVMPDARILRFLIESRDFMGSSPMENALVL